MENGVAKNTAPEDAKEKNRQLSVKWKAQHGLVVGFFTLILCVCGFLLSRLVLPDRSECGVPPIALQSLTGHTPGSIEQGCWYPKSFDKAVVILIDALRYDFTVPFRPQPGDEKPHHFHNALPVLHEIAVAEPRNAFLRPFIADPPTTTLQRLKGLMTGTLPTFIDAGSNFAGTAIDEDNLVEQLYKAQKKVVHLGDDTWHALFPGLFEPELTKPYDSFNVWDLHTLDNGVNEHIFPLLEANMSGRWDVIIGHYLGVDHAGHRYGPDHPAMAEKLGQMDGVLRRLVEKVDDQTLLVVMGDHGMDVKGDHGGESDDEVEAAVWFYSKKGIFAHGSNYTGPPATAKERPVGQIDLVPTLALLLGLPIPFNNLGTPIEEAFRGNSWAGLAQASRITGAQIHQYQAKYAKARNLDESDTSSVSRLWRAAHEAWQAAQDKTWTSPDVQLREAFDAFSAYQAENLNICRKLWARFDLVSMSMGIATLLGSVAIIAMYAQGVAGDRAVITPMLLGWGLLGTGLGGSIGAVIGTVLDSGLLQATAFGAAAGGLTMTSVGFWPAREILMVPLPRTFWGGLCFLVTALLCAGFASNSFTIWEDEQLLFILTTFGILMLGCSIGRPDHEDKVLGATHSISFLVATRISSLSRLCREEQMPNCKSTYYASATSSTSAQWQLAIPFVVALVLPTVIRDFYVRTRNYQGSAVLWIGIALRVGLFLTAIFWVIDAADDGDWYPDVSKGLLKSSRVLIAQGTLALSFAAGYATYVWALPLLAVKQEDAPPAPSISKPLDASDPMSPVLTTTSSAPAPRSKLIILGYANSHGSRYFLLPCVWVLALLLTQKPMGQGTLALCTVSLLNILEVIDALNLRRSPLGPTLFALLGSYYFFKTGHQAVLSTIQWESAFIPLHSLSYPLAPLMVILNTFGPHLLCALAVPAIPMWKVAPRSPGLLGRVAAALATHLLFYAALALATIVEAAWLRRHLMLYRVFMPRMLLAAAVLLLVDLVAAWIALLGVRWSVASVNDVPFATVFGWPEV
nr:gpi ethanolamine phosphate transferase 3 [Quercus suber]